MKAVATWCGMEFPIQIAMVENYRLRSDLSVPVLERPDCAKDGCHVGFNIGRGYLGAWECRFCDNYVSAHNQDEIVRLGIVQTKSEYIYQRVWFSKPEQVTQVPEGIETTIIQSCNHFFECDYGGTQTFKCTQCDYCPNVDDEEFMSMLDKANYVGMTVEEFQHMRKNV